MEARALFFTGIGQVAVRRFTLPDPGPDEVLIATEYSAISPGTELRCLAGRQPGAADWPYIPGYALTGRVVAGGTATTLAPGTPIFCTGTARADATLMWGGHVSHAIQREATVVPLAAHTSLRDAALMKLAAIALHGLRVAKLVAGQHVVVLGLGPVGQLSARLAHALGAQVIGVDLMAARAERARAHNIIIASGPERAQIIRDTFPNGPDIIVDATGAAGVIAAGIDLARDLTWDDHATSPTTYVIQGSYAGDIAIDYQAAFMKELALIVPRDAQPRDLREARDLITSQRLVTRDLITSISDPSEATAVYADLQTHPEVLMVPLFAW